MASRIEWWLVEVESRLSKHLPKEQVNEISEEARNHLSEIRDGFGESHDAEAEAIRQFGSPEVFADEVLDSIGTKNNRKLFWQVFSIAAVGTAIPAVILEAYETFSWQPYWSLLIILLLIGLFCRACLRSRKMHFTSIFLGTVAGYVALAGYLSLTHVKLQPLGAVRVSEAKQALVASRLNLEKLSEIQRQMDVWAKTNIEVPQKDGSYEVPSFYVGISQPPSILEMPELVTLRTKSLDEARRVYEASKDSFRRQNGVIKEHTEDRIAVLTAALSHTSGENAKNMFEWATPTMVPALILLPTLNLLILAGQRIALKLKRKQILA